MPATPQERSIYWASWLQSKARGIKLRLWHTPGMHLPACLCQPQKHPLPPYFCPNNIASTIGAERKYVLRCPLCCTSYSTWYTCVVTAARIFQTVARRPEFALSYCTICTGSPCSYKSLQFPITMPHCTYIHGLNASLHPCWCYQKLLAQANCVALLLATVSCDYFWVSLSSSTNITTKKWTVVIYGSRCFYRTKPRVADNRAVALVITFNHLYRGGGYFTLLCHVLQFIYGLRILTKLGI